MTNPESFDGPLPPNNAVDALLHALEEGEQVERNRHDQIMLCDTVVLSALDTVGYKTKYIRPFLVGEGSNLTVEQALITIHKKLVDMSEMAEGPHLDLLRVIHRDLFHIECISLTKWNADYEPGALFTTKQDVQSDIYLDASLDEATRSQLIDASEIVLAGESISADNPDSFSYVENSVKEAAENQKRQKQRAILLSKAEPILEQILSEHGVTSHDDLDIVKAHIRGVVIDGMIEWEDAEARLFISNLSRNYTLGVVTKMGWTEQRLDQVISSLRSGMNTDQK